MEKKPAKSELSEPPAVTERNRQPPKRANLTYLESEVMGSSLSERLWVGQDQRAIAL